MMIEIPDELKLAQSFLEDIKEQVLKLQDVKADSFRAKYGLELLSGDITRAKQEVDKAERKHFEVADIKARVFYAQGLVARTVYTKMIIGKTADMWKQYAVESFKESITCSPISMSYYQLGLVYADMYRWDDAINTLQQVANSNDDDEFVY